MGQVKVPSEGFRKNPFPGLFWLVEATHFLGLAAPHHAYLFFHGHIFSDSYTPVSLL